MNPLQRALIEKAGHEYGFEYVATETADSVNLASARHRAQVAVSMQNDIFVVVMKVTSTTLLPELLRSFPEYHHTGNSFLLTSIDDLARLLQRTAALAQALPNQAAIDYEEAVNEELSELPASIRGTEVERIVRQRVGQQIYRQAMLDYWGDACAVTRIAIPGVLRASHAKPWAECESDAERLDVFNGFLLCANLDALFDRFLISFTDTGALLISPTISEADRARLGLRDNLALNWMAAEHLDYLHYHQQKSFTQSKE